MSGNNPAYLTVESQDLEAHLCSMRCRIIHSMIAVLCHGVTFSLRSFLRLSAVVGGPGATAPPDAAPTYRGEVPAEDVHENAGVQSPTQPSAPPISDMDCVSGYEGIGFQGGA